ncbi:MAG TPA: hypothetical protein VKD26_08090 [Streptosporangiaceae bacterium]|nr:hypothetical protein [Streptosporangiaceae bacterium]
MSGEEAGREDRQLRDEDLVGHRDGDVIGFGPHELADRGKGKPLTVWWEIEVTTGKRGELWRSPRQRRSRISSTGWLPGTRLGINLTSPGMTSRHLRPPG